MQRLRVDAVPASQMLNADVLARKPDCRSIPARQLRTRTVRARGGRHAPAPPRVPVAALDKDVLRRHNRHYTTLLPFGQVENQAQSGNCWLYAPTVLVRAAALQKGCISPTESFSETYLYFFDLLEKARAALLRVHRITTSKEPVDGATLRHGLKQEVMGLVDGGEWEWAFNLIEKYGLVPARRMPPQPTRTMRPLRVDLRECLARDPRDAEQAGAVRIIRDETMHDVVQLLVAHLKPRPPKWCPGAPSPTSMPSRSSVSVPVNGAWSSAIRCCRSITSRAAGSAITSDARGSTCASTCRSAVADAGAGR